MRQKKLVMMTIHKGESLGQSLHIKCLVNTFDAKHGPIIRSPTTTSFQSFCMHTTYPIKTEEN